MAVVENIMESRGIAKTNSYALAFFMMTSFVNISSKTAFHLYAIYDIIRKNIGDIGDIMDAIMILIRFFIWIGVNIAGVVMLIKAIIKKEPKRNAIIAFILGLIAFITLCTSSMRYSERHPSESTSSSTTEAVTEIETTPEPAEEPTPKITAEPIVKSTPEPTEEPTPEPVVNNDNAILHRESHPTYYGSTSKAHEVWDDVEKGKIVFADSYSKYSDSTIILMDGYQDEKKEIIHNIEIYLKNADDSVDRTLDGALDLASEYLPYGIINQWYKFNESYSLVPEADNDKDDDIYYVVEYSLTDAGSDAYYAGEHKYSGIDIVIRYSRSTNEVQYITIGSRLPRWFYSLKTNSYEQVDWEYNFLK